LIKIRLVILKMYLVKDYLINQGYKQQLFLSL
jgi:hypothetical protein